MAGNYSIIIRENLARFFEKLTDDLPDRTGGQIKDNMIYFNAFGDQCRITPDVIYLGDEVQEGPLGIILSLYLLHARKERMTLEPFKAFKEFPDSMPYTGAFVTHTESILAPYVERIESSKARIDQKFNVEIPSKNVGDFSFIVPALPKISLCYIFYRADEDFPASATCLYSNNANYFMPMDGLADIGEYMSKKIISCLV